MPRLNLEIDEERLLRAYKISSLNPKSVFLLPNANAYVLIVSRKWEEVDHEFEESIGASFLDASSLVQRGRDIDPLGLPHSVEYVAFTWLSHHLLKFG